MIWTENLKFDKDEYCFNCNSIKEDCKELKFSVGDNYSNAVVICLCEDCRNKLKAIL